MEFIEGTDPVTLLGTHNAITFKTKEDKKLLKNEDTTKDILANCEDLKVLGKKEFKQLMKWRIIIREEMGLEVRKKDKKEDIDESNIEELPVNPDEQIAEDIERIENEDSARAKKERRRKNEKRTKEVQRMQLKMGAPIDIGLEQDQHLDDDVYIPDQKSKGDIFDLKHTQKHLKGRNIDEIEEDEGSSEEEPEVAKFEDAYEDEEDKLDRLEAQMDGMYETYQEKLGEKDRKHQIKEARRKDKNREAWGGIPRRGDDDEESEESAGDEEEEEEESEGEYGYEAKEKHRMQLDQDSSDEEEVGTSKKPAKKSKVDRKTQDEAAANVWFGNPLFKDVDGIAEESDEEEEEEASVMEEDEDEEEPAEEDEESDGFEVVPQEDDGEMWDVDDEDQDAARQKRIEGEYLLRHISQD